MQSIMHVAKSISILSLRLVEHIEDRKIKPPTLWGMSKRIL